MGDFPSEAYDRWVTQTPEEYFGEAICDECELPIDECECEVKDA